MSDLGMRGKDVKAFMMVARQFGVIILVRKTNDASLKYIGVPGYYPKPIFIKAKTADKDVASTTGSTNYSISGLVCHPGLHPAAYEEAKQKKAKDCWLHTLELLDPSLVNKGVDPQKPESWKPMGMDRACANAPQWQWRIDINPDSKHFGCLQLKKQTIPWSYVHGDYDLKDVIILGRESENKASAGKVFGVNNVTPELYGVVFERIRQELNLQVGAEVVQHGAEAQFAWHGDEPILAIYPDFTLVNLTSATTVQAWYEDRNRQVVAEKGNDYRRDQSRMFFFGPAGMFKPGSLPVQSWGDAGVV